MMRRDPVDWFEVISQVEAGDAAALLRLTNLIGSILSRIGAYRGHDSREDLIQEITLSVIRSTRRGAISDPARFVAYTWAVARNRLINEAEARVRRGVRDSGVEIDSISRSDTECSRSLPTIPADPPTRVDLKRGLAALPENERKVIEAIYIQGQTYAEVAAELQIPLGTVKRRQWLGLKALRKHMDLERDAP